MGLNLTLAHDRWFPANARLLFVRMPLDWQDYGAFERIKAEAVPLGHQAQVYADEGLRTCSTDPYGAPLTMLAAHAVARHLGAVVRLSDMDAAVLAYMRALPPTTPIVLWWH